jgi:hypothetical protein
MPPQKLPAFLADAVIIDGSLSGVSSMPFLELIQGGFHAANWTVAGGFGDGTLSTLTKIAERYSLIEQYARSSCWSGASQTLSGQSVRPSLA